MLAQFAIIGAAAAILLLFATRAFWLWYLKLNRILAALEAIERNTADQLEELRAFRIERHRNRKAA